MATSAIVLVLFSTIFLIMDLRKREIRHSDLESSSLAQMFSRQTAQNFDSIELVLQGAQERIVSMHGKGFPLNDLAVHFLLSARITGLHQIRSLFVVNAEGQVINSSNSFRQAPLAVQDRDYFLAFTKNINLRQFISKPERNRGNHRWSLFVSRPLITDQGRFVGVVVANIDIESFESLYSLTQMEYSRPLSVYLVDGTLIASLPHRENQIGDFAPELKNENIPKQDEQVTIIEHKSGNNSELKFSLSRVARFPLLVSVINDKAEALAPWRETALPIAFGAIFVNIFIAIIAMALMNRITRENALSQALVGIQQKYSHTVNSVMDAIVALDSDLKIVLFNPAAEHMFGISEQVAMQGGIDQLLPERFQSAHLRYLTQLSQSTADVQLSHPLLKIIGRRSDGSEFPMESAVSSTVINGARLFTAVLRDVTLQRKAEADLIALNHQLRTLSTSLQQVREDERTRISRELHDELGQQLTALKLDLLWLTGRIKDGRPPEVCELDSMRAALKVAISSVKRIASELRPLVLDDLGFVEALRWLASEMSRRSGLQISVDAPEADQVKDLRLQTALFRVAQESLTNVVKHANATQVSIRFKTDGPQWVLQIADDGQGMTSPGAGIGLLSMRERSHEFGGTFEISSSNVEGTRIEVRIPRAHELLNASL